LGTAATLRINDDTTLGGGQAGVIERRTNSDGTFHRAADRRLDFSSGHFVHLVARGRRHCDTDYGVRVVALVAQPYAGRRTACGWRATTGSIRVYDDNR
jgi:hypothetical protein